MNLPSQSGMRLEYACFIRILLRLLVDGGIDETESGTRLPVPSSLNSAPFWQSQLTVYALLACHLPAKLRCQRYFSKIDTATPPTRGGQRALSVFGR